MDCLPCGVGYYCGEGSSSQTECPLGTHNSISNVAGECTTCPAGFSCGSTGLVNPTPCAVGTWSDEGASACSSC